LLSVLRRMIERDGINAIVVLQPAGDIPGNGKDRLGLRNELLIGLPNSIADLEAVRKIDKITYSVIPEFIGSSVLVQKPESLVRMRHKIGRKLETNHPIHWGASALGEIQETASQHMIQDALRWVPFERQSNNLRLMSLGT
jgi:hypothetical protein